MTSCPNASLSASSLSGGRWNDPRACHHQRQPNQKGTNATPQGDVPYKDTQLDWRKIDGMTLPYQDEMTAGPATILGQITDIKFDEKMDPKMFVLPKPAKAAKAAPPADDLKKN